MILAFDGRAFCRELDSMDRVLRVLICAARQAGWQVEIWTSSDLRPDAEKFREYVKSAAAADFSGAVALWSPDLDLFPCALPRVATLHDINPLLLDGRNRFARWLRGRRFRRSVAECLAGTGRLVTDTRDSAGRIVEVFPDFGDRLSVVPLFTDPDLQPLRGPEGARVLGRFDLAPGFILFVGSLRRHKNWEGLLRAYAMLPPSLRKERRLVFAGRASRARGKAERLAAKLGVRSDVRILGVVDEKTLHALYGGAGLLACPSFMEGFGFPPLEAMSCGVPVVASDRTCMPEVLSDAAIYVNPGSIESIAIGLASVLEDSQRRERLVALGLEQAARYNPDRTARAMGDVLDKICS